MSMGSTSRSRTRSDPWSPAQPTLHRALTSANTLADTYRTAERLPGTTVAGLNTDLLAGLDANRQQGMFGNAAMNSASNYVQNLLDQGNSNPYLDDMRSRITSDTMQGVNATFAGGGRTGSDMHQYALSRGLSEGLAPVSFQAHEAEQNRRLQAAALAPQFAADQRANAQQLLGVGDFLRNYDQQLINANDANSDIARQQAALATLMGVGPTIGGMGGTQSSTQTQTQSPLSTGLGLGMMATSLFGNPFAAVGAGNNTLMSGMFMR